MAIKSQHGNTIVDLIHISSASGREKYTFVALCFDKYPGYSLDKSSGV